jgi:hypothetical protein
MDKVEKEDLEQQSGFDCFSEGTREAAANKAVSGGEQSRHF